MQYSFFFTKKPTTKQTQPRHVVFIEGHEGAGKSHTLELLSKKQWSRVYPTLFSELGYKWFPIAEYIRFLTKLIVHRKDEALAEELGIDILSIRTKVTRDLDKLVRLFYSKLTEGINDSDRNLYFDRSPFTSWFTIDHLKADYIELKSMVDFTVSLFEEGTTFEFVFLSHKESDKGEFKFSGLLMHAFPRDWKISFMTREEFNSSLITK